MGYNGPMTPRRASIALLLIVCLSTVPCALGQAPSRAPVVEIGGDNAALGTAHGTQLGAQVRLLQEQYLKVYLRNDQSRAATINLARGFVRTISPEHLSEIKALATASGMDESAILMAQCFLDLQGSVACSTITLPASASPDGVARFGRNLDFPGLKVAENNSVLLIVHPRDRFAFAAVSWPGLIGVLSGMNEHGLCLANMEVPRTPRKEATGMPYTLLYRTVLEKCKTVNEAIALLESTPRQTANNLMLMDAAGDRAVIEITPEKIAVRRASDSQSLISTNHQRDQDLTTLGKCTRFDRLLGDSANTFGRIDPAAVQKMLKDVAVPSLTMQSMVFEPANRVIYLAVGANAPSNGFERIDLKDRLKSR